MSNQAMNDRMDAAIRRSHRPAVVVGKHKPDTNSQAMNAFIRAEAAGWPETPAKSVEQLNAQLTEQNAKVDAIKKEILNLELKAILEK